jgi:glycosyltransferase involved in cell wall biosynthesis
MCGAVNKNDVYAVLHHPHLLSSRSGLAPLAELLSSHSISYDVKWERLQQKSWIIGRWLRRFGNRYYQSDWNALVPWLGERRILKSISIPGRKIVHFLWAEFARPKRTAPYRKRHAVLVGTYHATSRKQPRVFSNPQFLSKTFDWITVMSQSQVPFFVAHGFPRDRIRVILHGVDTAFFCPGPRKKRASGEPLRGLLVGKTERDHAFMADVIRKMPEGLLNMTVCTAHEQRKRYYRDVPRVHIQTWMSDEALRDVYRSVDVLIMPMHDCAANNAILEAMACGTPVMANCVGGVAEYLHSDCSIIMERKDTDDWVQTITRLAETPDELERLRSAVRAWAERFDWSIIAPQFFALYRDAFAAAGVAVP